MRAIVRDLDIGTGVCSHPDHKTPIRTNGVLHATPSNVYVEGKLVGRVGDTVISDCGHTGKMVSSSSEVSAQGKAVCRVGDSFEGYFAGTMITGARITTAN